MKARHHKRRMLRNLLVEATGCAIQHTGWPCNTCFHALDFPRVTDDALHEMWLATLVLRGDYKVGEYGINFTDLELSTVIDRLIDALNS